MSSAAILLQMQDCESQILVKQAEIAKFQQIIEKQETARLSYNGKAPGYEDTVGGHEKKVYNIESVAHELRSAQKAGAVLGEHKAKRDTVISYLDDIEETIKREMAENRELLYTAECDQSHLQQLLSSLGAEYQNALNREAEEAAAAAAAAR